MDELEKLYADFGKAVIRLNEIQLELNQQQQLVNNYPNLIAQKRVELEQPKSKEAKA